MNNETIDNNDLKHNICTIVRDDDGKISKYVITSYKKNRVPFYYEMSREQAELLFFGYSRYGLNLPKAAISPEFEDLSTADLERVIKALGIYKYDLPFAPHQIEELSEEKLLEIIRLGKGKKIEKKLEKNEQAAREAFTKQIYSELQEYKNLENIVSNIHIDFNNAPKTFVHTPVQSSQSLMLHLSDMHIGARCESDTLYENPWNKDEIYRRLSVLLDRISDLGTFDTIILNNLGDSIDGMDRQTARRDHFMPQNMDNKEQINTYIEVILWFIGELRKYCNTLKVYFVPCGNHGGIAEQISNKTIEQGVKNIYPDVKFTLFNEYRSWYEFRGHIFSIEHGKDDKFMKKGLPLNLDDKTSRLLFEWLRSKGLANKQNIHFIKGDLHSNNLNTCEAFTYRNTLSLFGASDYSNFNFSRNSYGVSYELFINNNMISGTFENL